MPSARHQVVMDNLWVKWVYGKLSGQDYRAEVCFLESNLKVSDASPVHGRLMREHCGLCEYASPGES